MYNLGIISSTTPKVVFCTFLSLSHSHCIRFCFTPLCLSLILSTPSHWASIISFYVFIFLSYHLLNTYPWVTFTVDKEGNIQMSSNFWTILNQVTSILLTIWNRHVLTFVSRIKQPKNHDTDVKTCAALYSLVVAL
jgi:hypothetical protein